MLSLMIFAPALMGVVALFVKSDLFRRGLLVTTAVVHLGAVIWLWNFKYHVFSNPWIGLDAAGLLFLSLVSVIFLASSVYLVGYLGRITKEKNNAPESRFVGALLFFLAAMSAVCVIKNLGLLWVAIEATTLASAPLIYFHRSKASLEATWKYLLICSVGIAFALIGNFFFAVGSDKWLQAGFIFLLVGYGTKMELAPMHTWLPDAYSESPSAVGALLSGALLNCAFLGIWRAYELLAHKGHGPFARELLLVLGVFSLVIAAIFLIRQGDFKRMLAYSSIENAGLIAIGVGVGGIGFSGSFLHAINHSFTKGALFLLAGNILARFRTKSTDQVTGMWQEMPVTGAFWFLGILAIVGMPPFGIFVSKLMILKGVFNYGGPWLLGAILFLLAIIFIGMMSITTRMTQGRSSAPVTFDKQEPVWSLAPPLVLLGATLVLCFYIPGFLSEALHP